ncbi:ABC transporter permease [Bifidobacterium lemurum]|uniref:ABC transporter permease n=1 Tax=Bifidobacterium lemurum TaxID=1603886 RepID=A0A261FMU1_9BIFI|nr:ABC transporter permease subunit [Bifidobacterium lemurum]OZG60283.1 ABC transporter permease [Bifidobacterium lemurum]QOL34167.1 ABC transporter permease subunit [Bifidobacterium lemurum]
MVWFMNNAADIMGYAWAHVWLSALPIVVGLIVAVPLGWAANALGRLRGVVLALVGVLYAIPSLPLLMVLPSLLGTRILDPLNIEVALAMYAVALMTRYAADAFASVDPQLVTSATAVGFGRLGRFFAVESPQAGPVLLAGMRVVAVSTVSLVTVGSLIGVNSLGFLFVEGYQRGYATEILVGGVGTVLIALVFDRLLVWGGAMAMPWTRVGRKEVDIR